MLVHVISTVLYLGAMTEATATDTATEAIDRAGAATTNATIEVIANALIVTATADASIVLSLRIWCVWARLCSKHCIILRVRIVLFVPCVE